MQAMHKALLGFLTFLTLAISIPAAPAQIAVAEVEPLLAALQESAGPTISLNAASGETVHFRTQNGQTLDGVAPQIEAIPHLVLQRNGALTAPKERTLLVEVSSISVPPAGVTVSLRLQTQHGDPNADDRDGAPVTVWDETHTIANSLGITETGVTALFTVEFDTVLGELEAVITPTDYFRYEIALSGSAPAAGESSQVISKDYAFLMENQWVARLPQVRERVPGAAPDELVIYYCDMFPFRGAYRDSATWLPRSDVTRFVQADLVPAMVEGFGTQTDLWGFAWDEAWTSYRPGEAPEKLTVALTNGEDWFHGPAPDRGNSGIAINVSRGQDEYDTLVDGLLSTYHHELFHNLQRNIHLRHGGDGDISGAGDAWDFFSEGTAVLASSVAQPGVQFSRSKSTRAYLSHANGYLGQEAFTGGDLNRSLERTIPYHAALYWRFLYEQCGGLQGDAPNPGAGMGIIRRTLSVLYAGQIVDSSSSDDLVGNLAAVMDEALSGPEAAACPFRTHKESVRHFARAIYSLRLEGGRCPLDGTSAVCGFYDPEGLLNTPPAATAVYNGTRMTLTAAEQPYPAGIESGYGIDLLEISVDSGVQGQPITVEVHADPEASAVFEVELVKLMDVGNGSRPKPVSDASLTPEKLTRATPDGSLAHTVETAGEPFNKLGLIITRVDAAEDLDPVGAYTIVMGP